MGQLWVDNVVAVDDVVVAVDDDGDVVVITDYVVFNDHQEGRMKLEQAVMKMLITRIKYQ